MNDLGREAFLCRPKREDMNPTHPGIPALSDFQSTAKCKPHRTRDEAVHVKEARLVFVEPGRFS